MTLSKKLSLLGAAALMAIGVGATLSYTKASKSVVETSAAKTGSFSGKSGEVLYVNGTTGETSYFSDVGCAVYCFDSSNSTTINAWSEISTYRVYNDYIALVIPKFGDTEKTWDRFIIVRTKATSGTPSWDAGAVYNQTQDLEYNWFTDHNCVQITGYSGDQMTYQFAYYTHYGIKSRSHVYVNVPANFNWHDAGAKFGIYFAHSDTYAGDGWGSAYDPTHTTLSASFLWEVNGHTNATNEKLYEAIVPQLNGVDVIWNLVIIARVNPSSSVPAFTNWGQSADFYYNENKNNYNKFVVAGYNLEPTVDTTITDATRANYYGQYFLDTVKCSGDGLSDKTTSAMWTSVKNEYKQHLSNDVQWIAYKATANEGGSLIEQAMARYDYICFAKHYNHEDFINRSSTGSGSAYAGTTLGASQTSALDVLVGSTNNSSTLIIVITIASLSVLGGYIFIRRRKATK